MLKKIIAVVFILVLCGCYNYNELNDLAIAVAVGIDKDENGYEISLEIVNSEDENKEKEYTIYTVNGNTLEEAINNLYYICPKKIYLSHLEVIVLGSSIKDLKGMLDYLGRNKDLREDVLIFLSDKKAKDILKTTTATESINALNIKDVALATYTNLGTTKLLTLNELLDTYLNDNKEIVIPSITIDNSDIKMDNMAVLKNGKIINHIDNNDILNYNILTNNIKNMIINTTNTSVNINDIQTNIIVKDNLNVDINIKAKGTILDVNNKVNLMDNKAIDDLNKEVENKIKDNLTSTLNKIALLNSDIIGILDKYYQDKHNYYLKIKDKWYFKNFKNIKYHFNIDINLYNKGKSLKVIK